MANKNKTFADRARELTKKYTRAEFDETEKNELESRLAELAAEQEKYKEANGLNEETNNQELKQFNLGGPFDPTYGSSGAGYSSGYSYQEPTQQSQSSGFFQNLGQNMTESGAMQYIPSLASGIVSTIGNIQGAKRAREHYSDLAGMIKDTPKIQSMSQTPQLLNLEMERSNIRKDFDDSKRIAARNIKNVSRGRGEYLSAVTSAQTSADRNKAKSLSESYLNEAKYNAAARERAQSSNIANKMRADQYNVGMDYETQKLRQSIANQGFGAEQQYRDAAWQIPGQMTKDMLGQYQQNQMIRSLGQDYGYTYDQDRKWWQMPQWKAEYRGRQQA
jgi:hypothetical protein